MIPASRKPTLAIAAAAAITSLDGCPCTPAMPSSAFAASINGTVLSHDRFSSGSLRVASFL